MKPSVRAAKMRQSFGDAEYHARQGYICEDTWRWYQFFWSWTAVRFSGRIGIRQDRIYGHNFTLKDGTVVRGMDFLDRRIARVKALWQRLQETQS